MHSLGGKAFGAAAMLRKGGNVAKAGAGALKRARRKGSVFAEQIGLL